MYDTSWPNSNYHGKQIVRALEGDVSLDDLNEGVKPGQSSVYSSSSDYDTTAYNTDMKKFRKMALSSQDSSEFGTSSNESREMGNGGSQKQLWAAWLPLWKDLLDMA